MKWIMAILILTFTISAADKLPPGKVNTMFEALSRLDPDVVNGNERLKAVLNQVLDATRGEPRFVGLVKKFGVKGREADLLDVAAKHPADPAGVQALGMVLGGEGQKAVTGPFTNSYQCDNSPHANDHPKHGQATAQLVKP